MYNIPPPVSKIGGNRGAAPACYCALLLAFMSATACSKPEFDRHPISGKITYAGKPVDSGFIVFEPDASKGNRGPQGYASIVHGRYETDATGKGAVGGPVKVRIVGLNAAGATAEDSGIPLFDPYETTIEIAADTTILDFDVPLSPKTRTR